MDEGAFRVGEGFGKAGLFRHFAEGTLCGRSDGDVGGEAPAVQTVRNTAHGGVVRRAAVTAGDNERAALPLA